MLFFFWGKEQIIDVSLLTQTKLLTRSPSTLTLPPGAKYFSCVARWQNEKGELGPWSDIQYIIG